MAADQAEIKRLRQILTLYGLAIERAEQELERLDPGNLCLKTFSVTQKERTILDGIKP